MNPFQQYLQRKQSLQEDRNQLKHLNRREDSLIEMEDHECVVKQNGNLNFATRFEDLQTTDNRSPFFPNTSNNSIIGNNTDEIGSLRPTLLKTDSNKQITGRQNECDESIISSQRFNVSSNMKDETQLLQNNFEVSFRCEHDKNSPPLFQRHSISPQQTLFHKQYQKKSIQQLQGGVISQANTQVNSEVDLTNNPPLEIGNVNNDIQNKKSKFNSYKNINLVTKIMKKMQYFYRNYTDKGKQKNLSIPIVRQMINDKSDIQSSTIKKEKLDKIKYYWKKLKKYFWRHPIFSAQMINPQHILSICIQIFFIASNFYYFTTLSLILIFQKESILTKFYDKYILAQWIIELLIKLNTAVFMKTNYIDTRKEVLIFYTQKKAIYDMLPILLVCIQPQNFILRQILRYPLFLKFYSTLKDKQEVEQQLLMVLRSHYIIQLTNLVIQLFFVGHIIACFWYFVGKIDQDYLDKEKSWMTLLTEEGDDWSKIYILSFYWAFTLMATGSNIANTTLEVYFTSIIMLFTTIVFGYMVNEIGIILSDINQQEEIQRRDINIINNYMEKKDIPKTLQRRVNLDLENYYLKNLRQKSDEEKEVLSKISKELNEALKIQYNKNILSQIKLLVDNFSEDSLKQLCLEVQEVFYSPEQIIFKEEDQSSSLMYIVQGKGMQFIQSLLIGYMIKNQQDFDIKQQNTYLSILKQIQTFKSDFNQQFQIKVEIFQQSVKKKEENENMETFFQTDWGKQFESEKYSKRLGQFKNGMVFGEQNFFTGMARNESVKSKDFTTIIKIGRKQFIDIIKNKEKDFQTFCEIKDKLMLYNDYSSINQVHMNNFCPLTHFHKDNEYIISRFNKSSNQERNPSFVRRRQQKITHIKLEIDNFMEKAEQLLTQLKHLKQLKTDVSSINSEVQSNDEQQLEEIYNHNRLSFTKDMNRSITLKAFKQIQDHKGDNQNDNSDGQTFTNFDESFTQIITMNNIQDSRQFDSIEESQFIEKMKKSQTKNNEKLSYNDVIMLKPAYEINKSKTITSLEKLLKQNARLSRLSTHIDRTKLKQKIQFEDIYLEHKKQQDIQWSFDQIKDFAFYFPTGNFKNALTRFNLSRRHQSKKKTNKNQVEVQNIQSNTKKQIKR